MDNEDCDHLDGILSSEMSSRWKRQKDPKLKGAIPERMRIEIDQIFREFLENPDAVQHEFPNSLNNLQRKYIHDKARKLRLTSKSHGKEPNRTLTITKRKPLVNFESFYLNLSEPSVDALRASVQVPLEMLDIPGKYGGCGVNGWGNMKWSRPVTVQPARPNPLMEFRKTLPVFHMKQQILHVIWNSRVVIISSETGSGKSTQIPQFILEEATELGTKCRVLCTQPRRISAVAVAERVATERGEELGGTVGYSIRLESRTGSLTALCYCTNGVLLRTLMQDKRSLNNITHVIVDEIHERDKYSDFLMIVLREGLIYNPHLKLILMSATLKTEIFEKYFGNAATFSIPGRTYNIQELFLDEILLVTGYESRGMSKLKANRQKEANRVADETTFDLSALNIGGEVDEEMDDAIHMCVTEGLDEHFDHLMQLIVSEEANVNYKHSETGCTGLMAAAMYGNLGVVEKLLCLGADIRLTCTKNRNACDWAEHCSKFEVLDFLREINGHNRLVFQGNEHSADNVLSDYDKTVNDEAIDFDLIKHIVKYIHSMQHPGSILVFLPGYDDIMYCQEYIVNAMENIDDFAIFTLHGSMQIGSQRSIFNVIPGKRKIILATNIAETSITIDDVVFVIDTGKAKEKTYDAISGIGQLQTAWISKACAKQRAGRAGRTRDGLCFHIYSRARYSAMAANRTPEILKVSLHELCLQTKKLAAPHISIAGFLSQAVEAPSSVSVQASVQALQALGALDQHENLTYLGEHILKLSAEPHLAKMLIYATLFKCLDPVLTIVSSLTHKDPFVLPAQTKMRSVAQAKRKKLSCDSKSDHMSFIIAFQMWQDAKIKHTEKRFCQEYFISGPTMEMILQTRVQLLSQLRASGFVQPNPPFSVRCLNKFSESWPMVKAVLAVGLYPSLAYVQLTKLVTRTESRISVHGGSCLAKCLEECNRNDLHNWMIFEELAKIGSHCSIKCATVIAPVVVALLCGKATAVETDVFNITIDDWLEFEPSHKELYNFRVKLEKTLHKRIVNPYSRPTSYEETIITTLHDMLTAEDAVIGLTQPHGFGRKPKLLRERENPLFTRSLEDDGGMSNGWRSPLTPENNAVSPQPHSSSTVGRANGVVGEVGPTNFAVDGFISADAEFYIVAVDDKNDFETAVIEKRWFLSACFANAARTFREGKEVILLFSSPALHCFTGISRIVGLARMGYLVCTIKWLCIGNLPHSCISTFSNPLLTDPFAQSGQLVVHQIGREIYDKFVKNSGPNRGYRPILGNRL